MRKSLLKNFLNYVSYDTISSPTSGLHPSTAHQFALAKELIEELNELGCKDVYLSDKCYCYATVDATDSSFP
ncbi:MAG: peptidase T, partial [Bacilli bacterium]|nr:peptidase T [Bacilli bacterium]